MKSQSFDRFSDIIIRRARELNTQRRKMKKILLAAILLAAILLFNMNISASTKKISDYKKACDGGIAVACNKLGMIYYAGRGVEQSDQKALELYTKACDGNDFRGCVFLGFMYQNGLGVKYNDLKAAEFYAKACNGDDALGCQNLGILYAKDENLSKMLCDK
ncbi:MAG: hypothetical protein COB07_06135 [Sulfurovum sp.]|nr:MAG: hypothetical protein COB07_06135 [Sulfurovum sp.]